jgi:hypothetical protein
MRITVMGVVIVIGGIVLLALVLEYAHRNFTETKPNEPKVDGDERPNLS